jgi:hypothetical protein
VLLKDTASTDSYLPVRALNGNVKNPDLFIHELFKDVLLTAQVIQLGIKGEGYYVVRRHCSTSQVIQLRTV